VRRSGIAIGGVAVLAVVLVVGYLLLRDGNGTVGTTSTSAPAPAVTSPYDLSEADDGFDVRRVGEAKFASLLLATPDGVTSYMVAAGRQPFAELARAVAAGSTVDEPAPETAESLTFVMPDRVTVTFVLDRANGLIAREGSVWRIGEDLDSLVSAVIEQAAETSE